MCFIFVIILASYIVLGFASRCCLLCCDVVSMWGVVTFVLSVMHVVGGVPL